MQLRASRSDRNVTDPALEREPTRIWSANLPIEEDTMGLFGRKKIRLGKSTSLNIGKRGLSVSQKGGPFTISSRGNASMRLGKGLSKRKKLW